MIAQSSGNSSEAQDNFREALRLLDTMKKDPGAENLMQRADLKAMYDAATAGMQRRQRLITKKLGSAGSSGAPQLNPSHSYP